VNLDLTTIIFSYFLKRFEQILVPSYRRYENFQMVWFIFGQGLVLSTKKPSFLLCGTWPLESGCPKLVVELSFWQCPISVWCTTFSYMLQLRNTIIPGRPPQLWEMVPNQLIVRGFYKTTFFTPTGFPPFPFKQQKYHVHTCLLQWEARLEKALGVSETVGILLVPRQCLGVLGMA
jgi:hypothetical protein